MSDVVLQKVFDTLPWPIWIVDDESRPVAMNRPAADLLACRAHVHLSTGRLRPQDSSAACAWSRALATVAVGGRASATVAASRQGSVWHFVFTPLSGRALDGRIQVLIALAGWCDDHGELALVQSAFGLTPGELRLLEQLVDGRTPKEACRALSISVSTVRTQLRALFAKTNTRRQAELVLLTQRFPRWNMPPRQEVAHAA